MSSHATTFTFGEQTLRVTFHYAPGSPDVMYLRNGDPGYPGDPEEFEPERFELETHVTDDLVARPNDLRVIWLDIGDMLWALGETAVERVTNAAYASWLSDLEEERQEEEEDRAIARAESRLTPDMDY